MAGKHKFYLAAAFFLIFLSPSAVYPLESNQILVIANSDIKESAELAKYYCKKRKVPKSNILFLSLGKRLSDDISREDYLSKLAEPVRNKLLEPDFFKIKCLLTTYGIPFKVGPRGRLAGQEAALIELRARLEEEKSRLENQPSNRSQIETNIALLKSQIDSIEGRETDASVDSELSMVLFGDYELYRWQPNELKSVLLRKISRTLMVSRLDGPTFEIAQGLIDKAITAEQKGLKGFAYIDSGYSAVDKSAIVEQYDRSLRRLAEQIRGRTALTVVEEDTAGLFAPGQCPSTAIYFGWYSLAKYIDSFDFIDGAIGIHIASSEAVNLRDIKSSQWCPSMLREGVAVTMGAVVEPYLHAFPDPDAFFSELLDGRCIVEAYYYTNSCNSWRLVLIADPLYRPFKNPAKQLDS
jgi:uncharacterized protein (TIGR03790 family)